jgi:hypothetical protein
MAASNSQIPGVRSHFKTPEGRYNLSHEKTHPTGLLHYNFGKVTTQVCDFCYPIPTCEVVSRGRTMPVRSIVQSQELLSFFCALGHVFWLEEGNSVNSVNVLLEPRF